MRAKKAKVKVDPLAEMSEKGFLFSKKNKVSVWASQMPYADIPDAYFEETFFKNKTRATNTWTKNYNMRYFRPDDLETNGVETGVADIKQVAGACSFTSSFILPLLSKARKKKLTEVSWLIFLYEYEYSVKTSGIENDDVTTFLGAFDYQDHVENVFDAEAIAEAERLLNPPEEETTGFSFKKPAAPVTAQPVAPVVAAVETAQTAPRSQKPISFEKPRAPLAEVTQPTAKKRAPVVEQTAAKETESVKAKTIKPAVAKTQDSDSAVAAKSPAAEPSVSEIVIPEQPTAVKITDKQSAVSENVAEKVAEKVPENVAEKVVATEPVATESPVVKKKSSFSFSKPKS